MSWRQKASAPGSTVKVVDGRSRLRDVLRAGYAISTVPSSYVPNEIWKNILLNASETSSAEDIRKLRTMCDVDINFKRICDDTAFWSAVLKEKKWVNAWQSTGQPPVRPVNYFFEMCYYEALVREKPGWLLNWDTGLNPKQYYEMVYAMTPKYIPRRRSISFMRGGLLRDPDQPRPSWFDDNPPREVPKLFQLTKDTIEIDDFEHARSKALTLKALPPKVTVIGNGAFRACTALALTRLPDGLTKIGYLAFYECTSLALTHLPDELTDIGYGAFGLCTSLALTHLPSKLTNIQPALFYQCTSLALTHLPDTVAEIGDEAFLNCTSLALTRLPKGLTKIGKMAFMNCTSLKIEAPLPEGLTEVHEEAFLYASISKEIRLLLEAQVGHRLHI